jgi:hypothetical protein
MRRHLVLLGIGVTVAIAAIVFVAPGARAVGGGVMSPTISTDPLPMEKQYRFVVTTGGTFMGHSGYTIVLTGDGTFGKGLTGNGVWAIYHGGPSRSDTAVTGTWTAMSFVHYTAWGGTNARAFGGQLTIMVAVQVDDGPP